MADDASSEPLLADGFQGSIGDFLLWTKALDDNEMSSYTKNCSVIRYGEASDPDLALMMNRTKFLGSAVMVWEDYVCVAQDKIRPYVVNKLASFTDHLRVCQAYGGKLFLPGNAHDLDEMKRLIFREVNLLGAKYIPEEINVDSFYRHRPLLGS